MSRTINRKPTALEKGDRVRLIAPASPFERQKFEHGLVAIEELGLVPIYDRQEFTRDGFLAGSDQRRAESLKSALAEPSTKAVWCIRGGYGSARLLPFLNLEKLRHSTKLLIGFSDVTALLNPLAASRGLVCIHGPVVTQFPLLPVSARRWFWKVVSVKETLGRVPLGRLRCLVSGKAQGPILGGNLSVLASLLGTPHMPKLNGSLLILEDVGEPAYRLDRAFNQLLQAGVLKKIKGVVLGRLNDCRPAGRSRDSALAVMERALESLNVPAVSGARFGHVAHNLAIPLGVNGSLDASDGSLTLVESAVG